VEEQDEEAIRWSDAIIEMKKEEEDVLAYVVATTLLTQ
jgi:hypothetical protein